MTSLSHKLLAYERVPTVRQGRSGLGLEAQRKAIDDHAATRGAQALAAAKARDVKLGNPNGAAALRQAGKGGGALRAVVRQNADEFSVALASALAAIRDEGHCSLHAIVDQPNARGVMTRQGGRWYVSSVRNLLARQKDRRSSGGRSMLARHSSNRHGL